MRRDAGFSLIEMVVAVLILSIAVVGLFRVYDTNLSNAAGLRDRALALIAAQNQAETIALGMASQPDTVRLAGQDWVIETRSQTTQGGFAEVTIRVTSAAGGPGAVLTTYGTEPSP